MLHIRKNLNPSLCKKTNPTWFFTFFLQAKKVESDIFRPTCQSWRNSLWCRVKIFFKFRVSVFLITFIWRWMFANLYLLILCARLLMSLPPLLHLPPSFLGCFPLDLLYLPISSHYFFPGLLSAASLVFICDIFSPVFGSNLTSRSGLLCFFCAMRRLRSQRCRLSHHAAHRLWIRLHKYIWRWRYFKM